MADSFATVVNLIHSSNSDSVSLDGFKKDIDKYLSQFEGFLQHDAQDFLTALLDSIHEDLNSPISKRGNIY